MARRSAPARPSENGSEPIFAENGSEPIFEEPVAEARMTTDAYTVAAQELKPALAARYYSSPEIFRLETERIFHRQWFCVGRADQMPAAGDYLHVSVAGESIFVLRGRDDQLRAFYNVCRHRGSRLLRIEPLPDAARPDAASSGRVRGG